MKTITLTNDQIIYIVDHCKQTNSFYCEVHCPLFAECLHWYTGENCGSALEEDENVN